MKRDSLFYTFFARSPAAIFDLLPNPPANANAYRFDSVSVKEAKFEMDGVFLAPKGASGPIYFCEVQMQKIKALYERLFAQGFLYFYRNRDRFSDCQFIVIYPSRSTEQDDIYPFRALLSSDQVHLVYLDELGDVAQLPIWISLMVLTVVDEKQAVQDAKVLIRRARAERSIDESRDIIELVTSVIWYKFEQLSFKDIQAMLDIPIKESRLYVEGRKEGQASLVSRQLTKRFGVLTEALSADISQLSAAEIEALGEAVLDFSSLVDLQEWLAARSGR